METILLTLDCCVLILLIVWLMQRERQGTSGLSVFFDFREAKPVPGGPPDQPPPAPLLERRPNAFRSQRPN